MPKYRLSFGEDLFFFFFFFLENTFIWTGKTVQISVKTFFFFFFFFFFLENTFIWTGKTVQISVKTFFFFGEHLNLGRKNRLNFDRETQCIKSFFGQKFAAPPNHFELLRPCKCTTKLQDINDKNLNGS